MTHFVEIKVCGLGSYVMNIVYSVDYSADSGNLKITACFVLGPTMRCDSVTCTEKLTM